MTMQQTVTPAPVLTQSDIDQRVFDLADLSDAQHNIQLGLPPPPRPDSDGWFSAAAFRDRLEKWRFRFWSSWICTV